MKSQALAIIGLTVGLAISSVATAEPLATVPFKLVRERVMVPVSLNQSNGFSFLLDSGFTMTMVHPVLAESLQLRRSGEITIVGIAGEERAPTFDGLALGIGAATYQPRRVAALSSDGRRRRDGVLGSGFFRAHVVTIDFARHQLTLHAPTNFTYTGSGQVVPMRFRRGSSTPIIDVSILTTNDSDIRGAFEIDTGCDSALCIGQPFTREHRLLAGAPTREAAKSGIGGDTQTRRGTLPGLRLGEFRVDKPEADFFLDGSPADEGLAGHIGIGVLNRFRVIFDYSRRQMILERR